MLKTMPQDTAKNSSLFLDNEIQQKKRLYKSITCPFCKDALEKEVIALTNSTSFLRKNKMPTLQHAEMYVLIESLKHDTHLEDMSVREARDVLKFAFQSMEWVRKQYPNKQTVLIKNRGHLSGGSQPHPHMQVVAFQDFNTNRIDFQSDLPIYGDKELDVGILVNGNFDLYQFILKVKTADADSERTVASLQKLMKWTVEKYGNYNMVHWREDGEDAFKVIPRYPGTAYNLGYSHYVKLGEEALEELKEEICLLLDNAG